MICWVSKPGKLVEEGPLQEIHNAGCDNTINFIGVRVPNVSCTHIWWVAARRENCSLLAIFDQRSLSRFLFPFPHSRSVCFFVKFQKQTFSFVIILAALDFSTCSLLWQYFVRAPVSRAPFCFNSFMNVTGLKYIFKVVLISSYSHYCHPCHNK